MQLQPHSSPIGGAIAFVTILVATICTVLIWAAAGGHPVLPNMPFLHF
ncbi:MAG: hypothetical protein ACKO2D_08190 [Chloroflexota bacterium]|jgi:hypothetical protein|nr:hypothetical protein [Chloroflexota bacterium]